MYAAAPRETNMDTRIIYSLSEPDTGAVRYVGQTSNISARLALHRKNGSPRVIAWLDELLERGLSPSIKAIREVPAADANRVERELINELSATCDLLNIKHGRRPERSGTGRHALSMWMANSGTSQTALATMLGITQPAVSDWLSGKSTPQLHFIEILRIVANIPLADWLSSEESALVNEFERRKANGEF
jgi:hypothetical protein